MSLTNKLTALLLALLLSTQLHADNLNRQADRNTAISLTIPLIAFSSSLMLRDNLGLRDHTLTLSSSLFVSHALRTLAHTQYDEEEQETKHFPSHIVTATFTSASFIHRRYGALYALPLYLGAGYLANERVSISANEPEDVWVGALVGSLSGYFLTSRYKGFRLQPFAGRDSQGLSLSKRW